MSRPVLKGQPEPGQQLSHRSLQDRIAAIWTQQGAPEANLVLRQQMANILDNSEKTEGYQQALEAELGTDRDAVIGKWMAKPDLFSAAIGMPLGPPRTPAVVSRSARSRPTKITGHMDTSDSPSDISTSFEYSASPMDISNSPVDSPTVSTDDRTDESSFVNRFSQRPDLGASKPSQTNQKLHQQALLPANKRQRRDRPKATKSMSAEVSSLASATNMDASGNAFMAQPSHTDTSSSLFVGQVDRYPVKDLPKWYISISDKTLPMTKISKKRPESLTALESLKNCVGRCEELSNQKGSGLTQVFDELRDHVHKAEIRLEVDKYIVRKARILHPENGLPRIFHEDANFPADLKADSYQLYLRWYREDFSQDVLRGIITVKGPNRGSDKLDQTYKAKFPTSAKHFGDGDFVNGQCWPSQLCLVRDGAHGSSQGGIYGGGKATYSIVLSGGGGYHDQDNGESIWYSGTDGKDFTPTEATQQMLQSASIGNVIRVIRSCNLKAKNKYRPEVGFRYDGLYRIKDYQLVDKEKQIYRFNLHRCPGQQEIRWGDDAMSRPTKYEIAAYKALKMKH